MCFSHLYVQTAASRLTWITSTKPFPGLGRPPRPHHYPPIPCLTSKQQHKAQSKEVWVLCEDVGKVQCHTAPLQHMRDVVPNQVVES